MKKLLFAIAMVLPMALSAQKYGHINTQELFAQMPEQAAVRAKMDTIMNGYETQLSQLQEEFQRKMQEYQAQEATMNDLTKQMRQDELQQMQQRIQVFYQQAEQDIQKQQQALLAPVHEKMAKAIEIVGQKEGYTYIFDSSVMVYIAESAIDVTPAVKRELGIQ